MTGPLNIPDLIESGALDDLLVNIETACRNRRGELEASDKTIPWDDDPSRYRTLTDPGKKYDHDPRPDDDRGPGGYCKDCGEEITWMGPSHLDWMHVNDERNR